MYDDALQLKPAEYIRKESLDLYNRLHSIAEDIEFVTLVAENYPTLPLLPNLRCGAWYTDPGLVRRHGSFAAYFKSTDGHTGNWSFNLRRPNLHLLPLINEHQGIVLVDSTRSGKRMPDALSKTVPIWCAVVNRAILHLDPERQDWDTALHTPLSVSRQEHDQIEERVDQWALSLANSTYSLPNLSRPLRPLWISPSTSSFPQLSFDAFYPVICVSASKSTMENRSGGYSYVQGSGDDHELWGQGLSPLIFWENKTKLLSLPRSELPAVVASVIAASQSATASSKPPTHIAAVQGKIILCAISDLLGRPLVEDTAYLLIGSDEDVRGIHLNETMIHLKAVEGKKGQDNFVQHILPLADQYITKSLTNAMRLCVACATGNDQAVGVALIALSKHFNDNGEFVEAISSTNKVAIRKRLEWIISARPEANPSRSTLKRVNEYLMSKTYRP